MEIEEKIAEAMALANIAMDTDPDNEECNDDDSDQVAENVVFDAAFLEEAHIAATIIQCMVKQIFVFHGAFTFQLSDRHSSFLANLSPKCRSEETRQ